MPAQRPTRVSAWLGLLLGLAQAHSGLARLGSGLAGSRLSSAQPGLTRLGPPRLIPCRLSSVPGFLRHLCFSRSEHIFVTLSGQLPPIKWSLPGWVAA